jgi:peptidoglycan glycosyltransferase
VNRPIARLFGLVLVLFGLLIAFTSRWTIFEAAALRANPLNKRALLEEQFRPRGEILAANGSILARSTRTASGTYRRDYPFGALFAHAVGYFNFQQGDAGLEAYRNSVLNGSATSGVSSILDQLEGKRTRADTVRTSLNEAAQRVAVAGLAGRRGAVVALDPSTGAIKVFADSPSYDPNSVNHAAAFRNLVAGRTPSTSLLDRVTQSEYAPGSTFKVVTAAAAIDTGLYTPQSVLSGRSPQTFSGVPLNNDGHTSYGNVSLTTGLTLSINTVFAQVATRVGNATMARYMARFGFGSKPPIDLPASETVASGVRESGNVLTSPASSTVDIARVGIGEGKLEATPLQMAMVAAAVANGGVLMVPHLTSEVLDSDGRIVTRVTPRVYSRVMKASTAAAVGVMMTQVVNEGTGTAAALTGVQVAGKTGTAQDCASCTTSQVWFIAYAPVVHPKIAIAVTVEHQVGFGGTIAAPIARAVLQALGVGGRG